MEKSTLSNKLNLYGYKVEEIKLPEFNKAIIYCPGDKVWHGELQYIAKDFVTGEYPDISNNWDVYIRTL